MQIREQARQCTWTGYDTDEVARDKILLQTSDTKLQQKILSGDLSYTDTIRHRLALEQRKKCVDDINSSRDKPEDTQVVKLEEEIRRLVNCRVQKDRGKWHSRKRFSTLL